ncbi:MAG: MFS transporter [Streptosporangiales bacterium]|nr:MFS transporter [Streptosporangiales bacterium]
MVLCWGTILFDGYDLTVYGAIVPSLLRDPVWHLTPAQAGAIGSYALMGMLVGALVVGTVTDMVGRRKLVIACQVWFSIAMGFAAFAPTPELLGLFRFVAGVGLGGVMPTITALTLEYAPVRRRQFVYAVMYTGYSVGGVLAALLAVPLIPAFGWRVMLGIGVAPLLLLVPVSVKLLPESVSFLRAKGRVAEAQAVEARLGVTAAPVDPTVEAGAEDEAPRGRFASVAQLFRRSYVVGTVMLWAAAFLGLLLVYGLATWLPEIMRRSGFPLGSALLVLTSLNVGAVVGTIAAARIGDRYGSKVVLMISFAAAAIANLLLSLKFGLGVNLLLVALAGFGSIGTAILMNAYVASFYPVSSRATGVGWSLSVGRLGAILGPVIGGFIVGSTLAVEWNFYVFGIAAVLGAVLVALVPRSPTERLTREETQRG